MRSRQIDKHMPKAIAGLDGSVVARGTRTLDRRLAGRVPFEAVVSYFQLQGTELRERHGLSQRFVKNRLHNRRAALTGGKYRLPS